VISRRRVVIALGAVALGAAPPLTPAQPAPRVARIGFLSFLSASLVTPIGSDLFRAGLRDLGYVEGKNIQIEFRYADGDIDLLAGLAAELVALNVDVIVSYASGVGAARRATATIPIVMANGGDPVAAGFAASLAHPGGNVTGSIFFLNELMTKRVELLKEVKTKMTRCGVLLLKDVPTNGLILEAMGVAAKALRVELFPIEVRGPAEFERAFSEWDRKKIQGLIVHDHGQFVGNAGAIAALAAKRRLASIGPLELSAAGGLMAYGVNFPETFRRAAVFVDKILKGARPGDIPIERATKFRYILNVRTAKAFGLAIPPSVLVRADEVIQ
jgi:putative ABC transport system substrate-binding protein